CTNRGPNVVSDMAMTYGMRNQIGASMGSITEVDRTGYKGETPPGLNYKAAINFFRYNMGEDPFPYADYRGPLFKTNLFYAPYHLTRDFSAYPSWQANDPLVHYTAGDLQDLVRSNRFEFDRKNSPIRNFAGQINTRYEPWTKALSTTAASSRTL